jgi:RNA polymerase sigma factor (sigma-70 family)
MANKLKEKYKDVKDQEPDVGKKVINDPRSSTKSIINSMISDLEFTIEWIENGRNPNLRRGADRKDVYLLDPQEMDKRVYQELYKESSRELTQDEKEMLEDAMCTLSNREREVFTLYHCDGLSIKRIADLLGLAKGTAQKHFERAVRKIEKNKKESLFLM